MYSKESNSSNNNDCRKTPIEIAIILTILDITIALLALSGNILIIYAVCKFKKLRTPTNNFVVAISISDILLGLFSPYYISFYYNYVPYRCDIIACKFRYLFGMFCSFWSLLLMIGLAGDRYIAVLMPLRYNSIVTRKKVLIFIIGSAIYMVILCSIPFSNGCTINEENEECDLVYVVHDVYSYVVVCGHVILTVVITSFLYWRIYQAALSHHKKMPNAFHKKWETNMTVMMVLILGIHLISLLPYVVVVIAMCLVTDENSHEVLSSVKKFTITLHFSKSIVSPFVCAMRNKDFRHAFRTILGCKVDAPKIDDFSFYPTNAAPRPVNETVF